jgi:hypothetical protein
VNKYAAMAPRKPVPAEARRCVTKAKFASEEKANRFIAKRGYTNLRAYRCVLCLLWHTTSKPL